MDLIPDPLPDRLFLLVMKRGPARPLIRTLIARFALRGPLVVLDGGNGFDAYSLARSIRRETPDVGGVLERVRLTRAFTCYQMLALLRRTASDRRPKVVLDLLATFEDDSVDEVDRDFLLRESISHLTRLSQAAPVVVCIHPPTGPAPGFSRMFDQVREAAGALFVEREDPGSPQPRLF